MGVQNSFLAPDTIQPRYTPAHHDCLAKMAKFVCKNTCPSVANYQSHLTIENNLKVDKKVCYCND